MGDQEQMHFEGLRVSGLRIALGSATDLEAGEELTIGQRVSGEWTGTVVAVNFKRKPGGPLIRTQVINVESAKVLDVHDGPGEVLEGQVVVHHQEEDEEEPRALTAGAGALPAGVTP